VSLPSHVREELQCVAGDTNNFGGSNACIGTGQIILIERPVATSLFLSLAAEQFSPYMHAGLIVIDDAEPYVYEAFGDMALWSNGPPTRGMGGGVRRVELKNFLRRPGIIEIVQPPPGVNRELVAEFARDHERHRTPFDARFDSDDDKSFYCVEFVERALVAAGAAPAPRFAVTKNASMRLALDWLGIESKPLLLAGSYAVPERRVWRSATGMTSAQIDAYFDLKQELHKLFTSNQRLGNVIGWRWPAITWRPAVRAYLDAGLANAALANNDVDAAALAQRWFDQPATLSASQPNR
jgi:hypothetical protein